MLEDLIDACVMECCFREYTAERDLLFHDTVALHLAKVVEQTFLSASSSDHSGKERLDYICQTLKESDLVDFVKCYKGER